MKTLGDDSHRYTANKAAHPASLKSAIGALPLANETTKGCRPRGSSHYDFIFCAPPGHRPDPHHQAPHPGSEVRNTELQRRVEGHP
ncbi:hypothetical protein PSCLAVI8L_130291 [Pseudoclavibacter sp. 8L]|nr:hypothetical protein PSCLAVI8L_130291 [Pseudoclavibacter sp. 8L]